MLSLLVKVELPNSGHLVSCEVFGRYYEEGDGFNDPHLEYCDITDTKVRWVRTGRRVKIKKLVDLVEEQACEEFNNTSVHDMHDESEPQDR